MPKLFVIVVKDSTGLFATESFNDSLLVRVSGPGSQRSQGSCAIPSPETLLCSGGLELDHNRRISDLLLYIEYSLAFLHHI
jgi:hypothetical protein